MPIDRDSLFRPSMPRRRSRYVAADGVVWDCESDGYILIAEAISTAAPCFGILPQIRALAIEAEATGEIATDTLAMWCQLCAHVDHDTTTAPASMLGVVVNARQVERIAAALSADGHATLGLAARPSADTCLGALVLVAEHARVLVCAITHPLAADHPVPELPARRVNAELRAAERAAALVKRAEGELAEADEALTAAIDVHHTARLALKAALRPLGCEDRERVCVGLSTNIDL